MKLWVVNIFAMHLTANTSEVWLLKVIWSFWHHKPNTDHCFKSRNACVLVWSPKKTICPGFLESSTKGQWDEMQSDRRRVLLSYLADRWCRLCVGVSDERMRQWRTKMREAALSAKAEFKVFAKSQAGVINTNQAAHAERSKRKRMKMIQMVKITQIRCARAHSPIWPVAMMFWYLGCWLTVRQRMSSVCSR